jgi:hypothetical protein
MTVVTEGRHWCEGIKSEASGHRSRDVVTIGNSQTVVPGSVLGKVTASGNYVAFDATASDGSENACAIALYPATTGASDTASVTALVRDCEFRIEDMMWKSGQTAGNITTGLAQLKALGIIARA